MQTPEIFFEAKCLYSLAFISVANTEPPLTQSLTEVELKGVIDDPYIVDLPCHTVAVERGGEGDDRCSPQVSRSTPKGWNKLSNNGIQKEKQDDSN